MPTRTMRKLIYFFLACFMAGILVLSGCGTNNTNGQGQSNQSAAPKTNQTLFAYVGANLKEPFTELAEGYEQKTGVKIEVNYNNSGALLNQVETARKGDIYMPGGMPFVEKAKEKGFIDQVKGPVAYHTPVIVVPKDNPAQIKSVYDLANQGVKLVIPDKEATAIGKTVYKVFEKTGQLSAIEQNIIANLETPAKVIAAIGMGQGNAGIVEFSNTLKEKDKMEAVEIDPQVNIVDEIPVTSLVFAEDKQLAEDFLNYVQENGPAAFEKYGFKIAKP